MGVVVTHKQEQFCQNIADGMTQRDAFLAVTKNPENWTYESSITKSSTWARDPAVKARLAEIRAEHAKRRLWSREKSIKALMKALQIAMGKENVGDMIRAVAELNKMHGYNQPETAIQVNIQNNYDEKGILQVVRKLEEGGMSPQQAVSEYMKRRNEISNTGGGGKALE